MQGLIKRIKGDLFDIKEKWDNPFELEQYFSFTKEDYEEMARGLRESVEEGVVEYKRGILLSVFSFLESLKYDSRGFDKMPKYTQIITFDLYTALLQRLYGLGILKPRNTRSTEEGTKTPEQEDEEGMKQILQDIQTLVKQDPKYRIHPAVKNILMQVQIYKRELENMKTLLPNILPEKKASFYANFRNTFNTINRKIQEHYHVLLTEVQRPETEEFNPDNLSSYQLKEMAPFFVKEILNISEIRSAFLFAQEERYKTREALIQLVMKREDFITLFAREMGMYSLHEKPAKDGLHLSSLFTTEIINYLERQVAFLG